MEHLNDQFYEDCPCPMCVYDVDTLKVLSVNKAAINWYGYDRDAFLKLTIEDICYQDETGILKQYVTGIRDEAYFDSGRWKHIKKNGVMRYVHTFSNVTNFSGKSARLVVVTDIDKDIEIEKRNQELLKAIELQKKQYEGILSSLTEVIWMCRTDTYELIYTNNACEEIFGYTAAEMVADPKIFFNCIHPEDKEDFMASFPVLFEKGIVQNEFRILRKDGGLRYLTSTATLMTNEYGSVDAFCGSALDITKQKLIEHAFDDKARETENILESITDAFFAADKNWNLTYANGAAEKLYNVKREEILHKNVWSVFPKVPDSIFHDEFQRAVRDRVPVMVEGLSPTSGRWVQAYAYPTKNGIVVYFKDITERKKLAEQEKNNIQNLNALINNTNDFVWSVDTSLHIISINKAYTEATIVLCGVKLMPGDYVLCPELGDAIISERSEQYARALGGEAFKSMDYRIVDGEERYRETSFTPIRDEAGNIAGVSCFSHDMTEQKKQLLKIQKQNQHLNEIAWIQSHKVRGPLATILGLSQLFDTRDHHSGSNEKIIGGIVDQAKQLDEMIREVIKKTYDIE